MGENAIFGTFLICNIPDIITKSRSLGQKLRVIWTWKTRKSCSILVMKVKRRGYMGHVRINSEILLNCIFKQ